MDKYSVEVLIKETLIHYCRNFVGDAVEFLLDGIICITINSEPIDTVFKIHETINGKNVIKPILSSPIPDEDQTSENLNADNDEDVENVDDVCEDKLILKDVENHNNNTNTKDTSKPCEKRKADDVKKNVIEIKTEPSETNLSQVDHVHSYSCGTCSLVSNISKRSLIKHLMKEHNGKHDTICFCMTNSCNLGFHTENEYLDHYQIFHSKRQKIADNNEINTINSVAIFPISSKNTSNKYHSSSLRQPTNGLFNDCTPQSLSSSSQMENRLPLKTEPKSMEFIIDSDDEQEQTKQCSVCFMEFSDFSTCDFHSSTFHGVHHCPYCNETFNYSRSLRDSHIFSHIKKDEQLQCNACFTNFSKFELFQKHGSHCSGVPMKISSQQSKSCDEEDNHDSNNNNNNDDDEDDDDDANNEDMINSNENATLIEPFFNSLLTENHLLADHRPTSSNQNLSNSFGHNSTFGNMNDISRTSIHDGFQNSAIQIVSDSEDFFENDESNLDIHPQPKRPGRRRYKRYVKTLDPNRCFTCEICLEYIPGGVDAFKIHCGQMHQRVPCPYCGCTYTQKASMERHQRQHTGERPYVCPLCPRAYTRKENLHMHMSRSHPIIEPSTNNNNNNIINVNNKMSITNSNSFNRVVNDSHMNVINEVF